MLATFVIGLREGLEAALIVGIIAAFLKRNERSLMAMWLGVTTALALSVAVGVGLKLVESSLPQKAQEGLETIIGVVAIIFVTGMVLWMRTNARGLKAELEEAAGSALAGGTTRALAVMAFLAVLKEGFETAVFMLATFQAAGNVTAAASGALLGVLVSVVLGVGIYRGGVRLNLAKFFTYTGIFLVLVASGLVVTALRTAHEAGWLNVGQQETLDLTMLAQGGTVRGALLTGVLGIPAKPRLIEVLGWFAYFIPMALYLYLPQRFRPSSRQTMTLARAGAIGAAITAVALFVGVPRASLDAPRNVPLAGGGSIRLTDSALETPSGRVPLKPRGVDDHSGVNASRSDAGQRARTGTVPGTLDAATVAQLNGGRMPFGVDASVAPGPYRAQYSQRGEVTAWVINNTLLDAASTSSTVLTLSGGGLATSRTFTVVEGGSVPGLPKSSAPWNVAPSYVSSVSAKAKALVAQQSTRNFWGRFVPLCLILLAAALALGAQRIRRDLKPSTTSTHAASEHSAALI